jgi:hypothetical protein
MKRHKYGARACVIDGHRFASQREGNRYLDLRLLEKAGEVFELELQPKFPLYVCRRQNGELHQVCTFIADFRYREGRDKVLIVEDSKGMQTPVFRLKRKMFEAQYSITLRLT